MRIPKPDQLTFEQLAEIFDTSISDINNTVNIAYNKMVHELVFTNKFDIWDVVMELKNFFKMTEREAFEKLNDEHKNLMRVAAEERIQERLK
jgi:hypothetical protein